MTEVSASRDALELASLQLTTTYYSATVVADVLSVGLVRRALGRESMSLGLLVALGATAALSTLSNPLYAAWAVVPIAVLLALLTIRSRQRSRLTLLLGVLLIGTALGFVGRIPLRAWIANTGAGYVQPERWADSLGYYGGLAADRLSTPGGVFGCLIVLVLIVLAVVVRTARAASEGSRFVAAVAWLMPVLVVIGAIALGTHAARYCSLWRSRPFWPWSPCRARGGCRSAPGRSSPRSPRCCSRSAAS